MTSKLPPQEALDRVQELEAELAEARNSLYAALDNSNTVRGARLRSSVRGAVERIKEMPAQIPLTEVYELSKLNDLPPSVVDLDRGSVAGVMTRLVRRSPLTYSLGTLPVDDATEAEWDTTEAVAVTFIFNAKDAAEFLDFDL